MIRARTPLILSSAALLLLTACADPAMVNNPNDPNRNAKQGALLGGILGATFGALTNDNSAKGAVKGGIIGAAVGVAGGTLLDRQEADLRRDLGDDRIGIENTGDRLIVTMPQDILFATDSFTVRSDLTRDLRAVASNLNAYPESTIQILGHTDNVGDAAYNQTLSINRANAVADVLMDQGVAFDRIQTIGRGETQPVASNLTPDGRAQNRRVEIVILPNA